MTGYGRTVGEVACGATLGALMVGPLVVGPVIGVEGRSGSRMAGRVVASGGLR